MLKFDYYMSPVYHGTLIAHYFLSTFIVAVFHRYYGLAPFRCNCDRITFSSYMILFLTIIGTTGDYGMVLLQELPCGQYISTISTSIAFFIVVWLPRWHFGSQLCLILDKMLVAYAVRPMKDRLFYTMTWFAPCFMMIISSVLVCMDVTELKFGGLENVLTTCMQTDAVGRYVIPLWMFTTTVQALGQDRERQRSIRIARFCFTITFLSNLMSSLFVLLVDVDEDWKTIFPLATYIGSLVGVVLPLAIQKSTFWEYMAVGKSLSRSAAKLTVSAKDAGMSISMASTTKLAVRTLDDLDSGQQTLAASAPAERTLFNANNVA